MELSGPSSIGACLGHVRRVLEVLRKQKNTGVREYYLLPRGIDPDRRACGFSIASSRACRHTRPSGFDFSPKRVPTARHPRTPRCDRRAGLRRPLRRDPDRRAVLGFYYIHSKAHKLGQPLCDSLGQCPLAMPQTDAHAVSASHRLGHTIKLFSAAQYCASVGYQLQPQTCSHTWSKTAKNLLLLFAAVCLRCT